MQLFEQDLPQSGWFSEWFTSQVQHCCTCRRAWLALMYSSLRGPAQMKLQRHPSPVQ